MNMNRYTNVELTDIHFICGLANGNGRAVVLGVWDPVVWWIIYNEVAAASSNVLLDAWEADRTWILQSNDWRYWTARSARTQIFKEGAFHAVERKHDASVRARAVATGRSRSIGGRSLKSISYADSAVITTRWSPTTCRVCAVVCSQSAEDMHCVVSCCSLMNNILTWRGVQYAHRAHMGLKQPTQQTTMSRTITLHWASIVGDSVTDSCILPLRF